MRIKRSTKSKRTIKADFDADAFKAKRKALNEKKKAKQAAKLDEWMNICQTASGENAIEQLSQELVPSSGIADTKAGELVRAMMRLLYRDYNDGDVFYEGYGYETCGPSAQYIIDRLDDDKVYDIFCNCAEYQKTDSDYTNALDNVCDVLCEYLSEHTELFTERNTEDSRNWKITDIEEWVPKYDEVYSFPDTIIYHIDAGHVSEGDVQWEIESWEHLRDADVRVRSDSVAIYDMNRETYDEVNERLDEWLDKYGDHLDEEYGSEDEEYEDEE